MKIRYRCSTIWLALTTVFVWSSMASADDIAAYLVQVSPDLKTAQVFAEFPLNHSVTFLRAYSDDAWDRLDRDSLRNLTIAKQRLRLEPRSRTVAYTVDIGSGFKRWLMGSVLTEGSTRITDLRDWFWVPDQWEGDDTILVQFDLPEGKAVSTPWDIVNGDRDLFRAQPILLERKSTVAFGDFHFEDVAMPGGALSVALTTATMEDQQRYSTWISGVAETAVQVFGRLPLPTTQILVMPTWFGSDTTPLGEIRRGGGTALVLMVLDDAAPSTLREDWTLYHEFSHLYHPYLGSEGRWLAEGLASYFQNILLARAGVVTADIAWRRLIAGFARGASDTTNGKTVSNDELMRTYWAGAVMALELDMRLREQSSGSETLESALRSFSECCLPTMEEWRPIVFMQKLDDITQANLFVSTYEKYSTETRFPEYTPLLRELGINSATGNVVLEIKSPLRDAIMLGSLESL